MDKVYWEDYESVLEPYFSSPLHMTSGTGKKEKQVKYFNLPSSFDIETTNMVVGEKPLANMYVWQWGFGYYPDDYVICMGRTWEEFMDCYNAVVRLANGGNVYVYVHNLPFEFQFLRKRLEWRDSTNGYKAIFATDIRKTVYAETIHHIFFKDSMIYTGSSLDTVGKNLVKFKVQKLKGNLDYSKPRNSKTPLTDKEIEYCVNDVLVVMAKLREDIETQLKTIPELVLTNTGNVRQELKDYKSEYEDHSEKWNGLTRETYQVLSECFMGGFTHCNPMHSEEVGYNIHSIDFTSSYPAVMLSEWFPCGYFTKNKYVVDIDKFNKGLRWCGKFTLVNVKLKKEAPDSWISQNHCKELSDDAIVYNGKVISASKLTMYITDVDYDMLKLYFDFEIESKDIYSAMARPLPEFIRECLYDLYAKKTTLKGVEGMEIEYLGSKGKFNSAYGISVQRVLMDHIEYDGSQWLHNHLDDWEKRKVLEKYNTDQTRTLYYGYGVWVTAFARANLLRGIWEMKNDYWYSDTDSIKFSNYEKHKKYIDEYNKTITAKLIKINGLENYNKYLKPKDIKGKEHPIGVWDYEGCYDRFKALRAKAYLTESDGELTLTCAGVSKVAGTKYISEQDDPFEWFNMNLEFPPEATGKLAHSYVDDEYTWNVTDEYGNTEVVNELSCCSLIPCGYEMNDKSADHIRAIIKKVKELKQK